MKPFSGIWVPLVTPFIDGGIDYAAAKKLARHLVEKGVHGLVVCGTTGEASSLNQMEKTSLLEAVMDEVGGQCPIVTGLSGSNTRKVCNDALAFGQMGINGYLVTAPYFVLPSQEGIVEHFQQIAKVTELPIVIYNIPARTGVNIEVETIRELCQSEQFVAVKECFGQKQLLTQANDPSYNLLCGSDTLIFTALAHGGHGAITASAAVAPELFVAVYKLVQQGKLEAAQELFNQLMPLIGTLFSEPNPAPVKAALAIQGWIHNELRLPMLPASDECQDQLQMVLDDLEAVKQIYSLKGVISHAA